MNLDIISKLHIIHRLRRDEDELLRDGCPSSLDHHAHADIAVDLVHEDIEFVQTSDRTAHGIPEREEQANRGEGFLATRECLGLPSTAAFAGGVWLNVDLQCPVRVADYEVASEVAIRQKIAEVASCSGDDLVSEHFPTLLAVLERRFQSL